MAYFTKQPYEIIIILLWGLVHWGQCGHNCDKESCSNLFQKTFADLLTKDSPESICSNIKEVTKCVNDCSEDLFSDFILFKPKASVLNEVCDGSLIYDLMEHWKCLRQHLNALLTCIASAGSIYADKSRQNVTKLITCKKFRKIFLCPQEVMDKCGDNAVETMEEIFKLNFYALLEESCFGVPIDLVFNLKVRSQIDDKYLTIAVCMDKCSHLAINSFAEYMKMAVTPNLNNCSENAAEVICKESSSSNTCPPSPLSASGFYTTIFSHGKKVCKDPSLHGLHQLRVQSPEKSKNVKFQNDIQTQESTSKLPSIETVLSEGSPSLNISFTDTISDNVSLNMSSNSEEQTIPAFNLHANSKPDIFSEYENISNVPLLSKTTPAIILPVFPRNISSGQPDMIEYTAVNSNHSSCATVYFFHAWGILIIETFIIVLSNAYMDFNLL